MKIKLISLKILFFVMYVIALQQAVQAATESLEGKSVDELVVIVKKRKDAYILASNNVSSILRQRTQQAQRNSKYKPTSTEQKQYYDAIALRGRRVTAFHAAEDALAAARGELPASSSR